MDGRSRTLPAPLRRADRLFPLVGGLLVFLLAGLSIVSYASSDPYLGMLLSQSMVEHGTVSLDPYRERVSPPLESYGCEGMILCHDGRLYYYFPNGPSLFVAPFVAVANAAGYDMGDRADNFDIQRVLSAGLAAAIFITLYGIIACYLDPAAALVVALVSVLGSSLISTVGTALWNVGFSALFTSLALWLIVRVETGRGDDLHPVLLGGLLFAAYASRPTSAVFIALAFLYLLARRRWRAFLGTAVVAGLLLLLFVAHSQQTYGQLLPPYYDFSGRVSAQAVRFDPWLALIGQTFSPSRGLFIYSPFLLLVLLLALTTIRRPGRRPLRQVTEIAAQDRPLWPLLWFSLAWFGLHLLLSARATRWWGGHSYGPRLLTDALPPLVLLTAIVWRDVAGRWKERWRTAVAGAYLALGLIGIVINSGQGLFNQAPQMWNGSMLPNVDAETDTLFDWRYPQFLATSSSLCVRNRDYVLEKVADGPWRLERYEWGETLGHNPPFEAAAFIGWSAPEPSFRWSQCRQASLLFRVNEPAADRYRLSITAGALGEQRARLALNGTPLGEVTFTSPPGRPDQPMTVTLPVEGALFHSDSVNRLTVELPDARIPWAESRLRDQRILGLALVELVIAPE